MDIFDQILHVHNLRDEDGFVSDELTDLIERAQMQIGSNDLSEILYSRLPENYDLDDFIWILDVSAWCGDENSAALHRSIETWLDGNDPKKIYVALNREVYPFTDADMMVKKLNEISVRFPQFKKKCEALIVSRKRARLKA